MGDVNKPQELLDCMKAYIRADTEPELTKHCLVRYMNDWDTITETTTVYRGQNYANFKSTPLISVSTSRKAAEGFAMNRERGRVFTLYLHPGVRYLDFSNYYDKLGIVTYQHEAEFVIAGNSEFIPRKDTPLVIDVYPTFELVDPEPPAHVKVYNVRGPNARLFANRYTRNNMAAVNGGRRKSRRNRRRGVL